MANQKISNLKSLNAETVSAEDLLPIVDVSSPNSLGGELKKISVNQLIGHVADLSFVHINESLDNKYDKTGGTIAGDATVTGTFNAVGAATFHSRISVPINPIFPTDAASKKYVDDSVLGAIDVGFITGIVNPMLNGKYDKSGGTISGNVNILGSLSVSEVATFNNNIIVPPTPSSANHATSKQYVDNAFGAIPNYLHLVYPIGSIYITVNPTNPSTVFGFGTWVAFATGRTIVGVDTGQSEFNTIEKVGGSKEVVLEPNQIPSHAHIIPSLTGTTNVAGAHSHRLLADNTTDSYDRNQGFATTTAPRGVAGKDRAEYIQENGQKTSLIEASGAHSHVVTTAPASTEVSNGGGAHSNLQPYITVYMWKRTA